MTVLPKVTNAVSRINGHRHSGYTGMTAKQWLSMAPFQRAEALFYARDAVIWEGELLVIQDVGWI